MIVWGGNDLSNGGRYTPGTDSWTATSTTNSPTRRSGHTAVWTGRQMIVWGGSYLGSSFNTGGRYNPGTDSWISTSTANAPSSRYHHTAVWTGSEMIVWGGFDGSGGLRLNTGGKYNPSTDSWTATTTANAPSGRLNHTAIWTGSEMIVWGGFTHFGVGGGIFNTGGRYNPGTNHWAATSITNAPSARLDQTAVWTGSEMIVWGGTDGPNYLNTGGRYNPGTNSWTATSINNAPTGRDGHTAVWTGNEMIVWGGFDVSYTNTGGRYNSSTDSWTTTSTTNAPTGRSCYTVWTGGEMIVWGGYEGGYGYLNTGARYNPDTDSWTVTSGVNRPTGRSAYTSVWTGSEMIVWGGLFNDGSDHYLNSGGRYNPSTNRWTATSTANAPTGRAALTAVWTGSEMIVWGAISQAHPQPTAAGDTARNRRRC